MEVAARAAPQPGVLAVRVDDERLVAFRQGGAVALHEALEAFEGQAEVTAEDLQTTVFTVGKGANYENLREWFQALYQVLLGQDQGPRFGSFIALYGVAETRALLMQGMSGELASA